MPILSAFDAISPAFSRTRLILFSPFRKGRTWKLALTAYLSIGSTIFLPYFLIAFFFIPMAYRVGGSSAVAILVILCAVFSLIYLVLFYLCSRLRFAIFDIVLNRGEFIAPAWRKYGPQSFKWTAFKVIFGTIVTAIIAVPIAAWIRHLIPIFATLPADQAKQPLSPQFISLLFTMYGTLFLLYAGLGLFYFVSSLLGDFIIPSLALEDTTLTIAFQRIGQLIRREPGQFTLYAILKLGIALTAYMAVSIAFYIVILIAILVIGLIALLIGYLLHLAHVPTAVLMVLGILLAIASYFFLFLYGMAIGIGSVLILMESYTLYFLSGRYPLLGDLLQKSTPPPAIPPAPAYPAYANPHPPVP
jgi:hypothetical protein